MAVTIKSSDWLKRSALFARRLRLLGERNQNPGLKECPYCKLANIAAGSTHCTECAAAERKRRGTYWYRFKEWLWHATWYGPSRIDFREPIIDNLEIRWDALTADRLIPAPPAPPLRRNGFGQNYCEIDGCMNTTMPDSRRCLFHVTGAAGGFARPAPPPPQRGSGGVASQHGQREYYTGVGVMVDTSGNIVSGVGEAIVPRKPKPPGNPHIGNSPRRILNLDED